MDTARRLGWYPIKIHGSAYQLSGLPDVLALKGGVAVWLEVKRHGESTTRIQEHRMRELEEAGCIAAVVRSPAEAAAVLGVSEA